MAHETSTLWADLVDTDGRILTAQELVSLPDDGDQYELLEGRLLRMPPPESPHGYMNSGIDFALQQFVRRHKLGRVFVGDSGFLLSIPGEPDTVLGPDVAFVRGERLPPLGSPLWRPYLRLAPDLVVEIASPSQYRPEMTNKARRWLAAGTRLVWVVWPSRRSVDVWRSDSSVETLQAADSLDGLDVLPGFQLLVAGIFE